MSEVSALLISQQRSSTFLHRAFCFDFCCCNTRSIEVTHARRLFLIRLCKALRRDCEYGLTATGLQLSQRVCLRFPLPALALSLLMSLAPVATHGTVIDIPARSTADLVAENNGVDPWFYTLCH